MERGSFADSGDRGGARTAAEAGSSRDEVRERGLLDAHVDNSPLAVIEFDPDFRVIRWAASAERVFGYTSDEMVGRAIGELRWVYEEDEGLVARESALLLDGTKARGVNVNRNYRKDGTVIWCEWYNSAIHDVEGRLVSVLSLVLDITERKTAEEAARRELERTRVLLDTAAVLSSGRSLHEVLDAVCDALLSAIPHRRVIVSLCDETCDSIVTVASKGEKPVPPGEVIKIEDLTAAGRRVLKTRRAEVIDYDAVTPGPAALLGRVPSHLALGVPLVSGDDLVGLFTIDDPDFREPFDARELELAQAIASQAGIAIERARLYDEQRERTALSEALAAVDLAIHASLEWEDIADRALSESAAALGADAAVILGREESGQVVWTDYGFDPSIRDLHLADNPGLSEALDHVSRGPVVFDDALADERVAAVSKDFQVKSAVAAPLVVRGEPRAALALMYRQSSHRFTAAEAHFVSQVASGLSLALENARLYAGERDLADRLQHAMLTVPDQLEGVEFAHAYRSAAEAARVGGDFYDLFEVGDGRIGITIGDVAGKGLEAAVLTSLAKNSIRAHACEQGKSPAEVLELTNDVILKATPVESFVTVVFGLFDASDGRLEYSNAGHTSGVISRPDGTTVSLPANGPILGALPGVSFGQAEVRLGPDDLLFLYTDGLTEARRGKEQYGEDRVFDLVARKRQTPLEAVERVAQDVLGFTGDGLGDDLALLALKRAHSEDGSPPAECVEL